MNTIVAIAIGFFAGLIFWAAIFGLCSQARHNLDETQKEQ